MTTLETLQALLAQQYKLDPGAVTPDATLETLGVDSLGLLEVLFEIEDRFGIKVPTERPALQTIAEVAAYVDRLVVEQQGAEPHAARQSGTGPGASGTSGSPSGTSGSISGTGGSFSSTGAGTSGTGGSASDTGTGTAP